MQSALIHRVFLLIFRPNSVVSVQAPLLLSLNGSMLYLGIALGAVISGSLIGHPDLSQLSSVGVPFGLLALLTLVFEPAQRRPMVTVPARQR